MILCLSTYALLSSPLLSPPLLSSLLLSSPMLSYAPLSSPFFSSPLPYSVQIYLCLVIDVSRVGACVPVCQADDGESSPLRLYTSQLNAVSRTHINALNY